MNRAQLDRYWQAYLALYPNSLCSNENYEAEQFGDNPALANELGNLILAGVKTATCSALWEWEAEGSEIPKVGLKTIVLDGNDNPLCIIATTDVEIRSFNQVNEQFAFAEGEGDRSLESWRQEHWKYFSRVLSKLGKQPTPEMLLVCERFQVVCT
ncbi:ASCH domain-containing protein [Leptothoe sp. ISB3NOV94-8A]|uniref:ASCH domain-containing protein n=1 Tax=Adonisia turfae CCMR0081 TaxID=2292702 RepID=A0A6M0RZ96_9CYAN|nr:ASCH domain-containing protein [Adonisia turfae]NEZ60981.1 ASCH domain-containing protein [Adonisia turfae CCMR0081]